jgi:type II secretory pathway component GspD/PulD (secretin)
MLRLLLAVLLVSPAFAADDAVPTHLKVKATFTRPDKDGKPEVYASPSVITVDGKQTTIRVGSAEEGVVFTVTPKVNKDGTLTLEAVTESREAPPAPATTPATKETAPVPRAKSNLPFFHGVLTKDKLFSIEDAAGKRQWVPLGRRIDGWTLKSYDEKREALTLSRLGQSVELVLHKAIIVDAPAPQVAVSRTNTTITVKPGAKTLLGGGGGRTIVLEAEILDLSK